MAEIKNAVLAVSAAVEILKLIADNRDVLKEFQALLDEEISMPNIPTPTMGGEVLWDTLAEYNGWKLQQNELTKHCRLLDPDNVRRAWGTKNGMTKAMNAIQERMGRKN